VTEAGDDLVSAVVVLRPAAGGALGDRGAVTADTINEYLPSGEAVAATQQAFAQLGFEVGQVFGVSFSITAPRSRVEQTFGTAEGLELPLDRLPPEIRQHVEAVTFTPPPDFGPTEYR
jgi:hypothetical protein